MMRTAAYVAPIAAVAAPVVLMGRGSAACEGVDWSDPRSATEPTPKHTLYYFNLRARASAVRMLLDYSGVEWEDVRVNGAEFQKLKEDGKVPTGQLPALSIEGGPVFTQSLTLQRYAAKLGGLYPGDLYEATRAESMVDTVEDLLGRAIKIRFSGKSEAERVADWEAFGDEFVPKKAAVFTQMLGDKKFLNGDSPSMADLVLYSFAVDADSTATLPFDKGVNVPLSAWGPELNALFERVGALPKVALFEQKRLIKQASAIAE